MSPQSHDRAEDPPAGSSPDEAGEDAPTSAPGGKLPRKWGIGTPLVFLLCGALFVVSAESSDGTDLRPGRYTDLASLVRNESNEVNGLTDHAADLNDEIKRLSGGTGDKDVDKARGDARASAGQAGFDPVAGSGVTVTLSDAPADLIESSDQNLNRLVVHQQDIQAVVNAMWKAGAEAVTIQGQRVITTTGIKCAGNAVLLQGVPYPQPYVIAAVGDQSELVASLDDDEDLAAYRDDAQNPEIGVGWDMSYADSLRAPAYDGLSGLDYAEAVADD